MDLSLLINLPCGYNALILHIQTSMAKALKHHFNHDQAMSSILSQLVNGSSIVRRRARRSGTSNPQGRYQMVGLVLAQKAADSADEALREMTLSMDVV